MGRRQMRAWGMGAKRFQVWGSRVAGASEKVVGAADMMMESLGLGGRMGSQNQGVKDVVFKEAGPGVRDEWP